MSTDQNKENQVREGEDKFNIRVYQAVREIFGGGVKRLLFGETSVWLC